MKQFTFLLLANLLVSLLIGCADPSSNGSIETDSGESDSQNDDNNQNDGENLTPSLDAQSFSFSFAGTVDGQIVYSDDNPTTDILITIETAPEFGTVEITDHGAGQFQYQVTSISAVSGDSFVVSVSDGTNTSLNQTMSIQFTDDTEPVVTLVPNDNAQNVAVSSGVRIQSDDPLDLTTLTYNSTDGACSGSIQISIDNFSNCLGISSATASNFNRTIDFDLVSDFDGDTEYKFKATAAIKNLFNLLLVSDITHTFQTSRTELLITEVGASFFSNVLRWFEIYNPSSAAVDLSGFSFKSKYYNSGDTLVYTAHTFSLPSIALQPGQYMVIRAQDLTQTYGSSDRVIHIKDGNFYPYWDDDGYIDLIKDSSGETVDFVMFGGTFTPTTASQWTGTFVSGMPSAADSYGKGIARDAVLADSDQASDWNVRDWTTPGGANDVTCDTDADLDGIPDCSEVSGSTFAGLPLYDWGARTGQRDIFIEIDYMDATDGGAQAADLGIVPQKEAMDNVVAAFAAQGIAIHFDVGDLYDSNSGLDPADYDLGGGEEVPFADGIFFDPGDARSNFYDYKRDYMDYARIQIFHYLMFVNSQNLNGSAGSSGLAELGGNDLFVSVGNWGLNRDTTANTNLLINYQASTLMHELGHNLTLRHGGNEDTNHKGNYLSIMNYLYQLNGLPDIGNDEGDRFYYSTTYHSGNGTCYSGLSNAPNTTTFKMDFSDGSSGAINIAAANETLGLGRVGSDGVDFNCNGNKTETSVNFGAGTWNDYDDWSNIDLVFQRTYGGSNQGQSVFNVLNNSNVTTDPSFSVAPDKVGNDRTQIVHEQAPDQEFFDRLRQILESEAPQ